MYEESFKQRVKREIINGAAVYKSVLLDYEYLIYSTSFKLQSYYIISAHEDNYQHLTGVNTTLPPKEFFWKCLAGTLQESDFDFFKRGQTEKSVKGSVRRKIKLIPLLSTLFASIAHAEENFIKNKVHCSLATADNKMTIGFANSNKAIPKTLLKGNELDANKAVEISIILKRDRNAEKFDTIIKGDIEQINKLFPYLHHIGRRDMI